MSQFIIKSLYEIKEQLPRGAYKKISKSLVNVTAQDVANAFTGRVKGEEKLSKIFNAATLLIEETKEKEKQVKATTRRIKKMARKRP